jgi:hypothetical protein
MHRAGYSLVSVLMTTTTHHRGTVNDCNSVCYVTKVCYSHVGYPVWVSDFDDLRAHTEHAEMTSTAPHFHDFKVKRSVKAT